MRALIAKEWWENRFVIRIFLVLVPLVSFAVKWGIIGFPNTKAEVSVKYFIPISTLLFMLAIASDLISADASSGRLGFVLALPIRARRVWAAKAVFLLVTTMLFVGYVFFVEAVLLTQAPAFRADLLHERALRWSFLMGPVFATGAATLFFSALVDRGLPAAILALLSVGGLAFAVGQISKLGASIEFNDLPFYALCAVTGIAFLAASLAAVTIGRIHLGSRLRRVALGFAAFFIVIVPPTAWAGVDLHHWLHPEPGESDIEIHGIVDVDPAGEWVIVSVGRGEDGGIWEPKLFPVRCWAVSARSGVVRDLTDLGQLRYSKLYRGLVDGRRAPEYGEGLETWSEGPGRIVLPIAQPKEDGKGVTHLRRIYDLSKGEIVSTRPLPVGSPDPEHSWRHGPVVVEQLEPRGHLRMHPDGREPVDFTCGGLGPITTHWGMVLSGSRSRGTLAKPYSLLMFDTGEIRHLAGRPILLPTRPEGDGWALEQVKRRGEWNRRRLARVPLDGSPATTLLEGRSRSWTRNRQFSRMLAIIEDRAIWVDADEEEPVELPEVRFPSPRPSRYCWSTDGRVLVVGDEESTYRITAMADGPRTERFVPPSELEPSLGVAWARYDGEHWLGVDREHRRLLSIDADGSTRQLLPVPEGRP